MTDPTREAFAVDEETINLALDAWFAGDCSRPHYDEHIDQMRAAASVIVAALSARAQGEADGTFAEWLAHEMPAGTIIGDPAWWANRIARQYAKRATPAVRAVDVDGLICALDEISGKCRALRSGGPDPVDLHGLSDALSEAVEIANEQLHNLLALTQPEAE